MHQPEYYPPPRWEPPQQAPFSPLESTVFPQERMLSERDWTADDFDSDAEWEDSLASSDGGDVGLVRIGQLQREGGGWFAVHVIPDSLFTDEGEVTTNYETLLSLDNNKVEVGISRDYMEENLTKTCPTHPSLRGEICVVCRGTYGEDEDDDDEDEDDEDQLRHTEVVALPCGHRYHFGCVAEWLTKRTRCPVCNWDSWKSEAKTIRR